MNFLGNIVLVCVCSPGPFTSNPKAPISAWGQQQAGPLLQVQAAVPAALALGPCDPAAPMGPGVSEAEDVVWSLGHVTGCDSQRRCLGVFDNYYVLVCFLIIDF